MNYFVTRTDQGLKVAFVVKENNGTLRTGLVAGDFVATAVDPADSTSSAFAVSESTQKAGVYFFTISSGFLTTNGVGLYPFSVEIDTFAGPSGNPNVRDSFGGTVRATQEDVDTLADGGAGTYVRTTDSQEDLRDKLNADLDVAVSTRASQASVDAIQNVTRVAITIPKLVIPDAGTDDFEITLNMFDTAGNPEDPDEIVDRSPAVNAGDAITATDRISVVNGAFTSADLNRIIRVSGSGAGNDGDFIIKNIVSGTDVDVVAFDGTDPGLATEGNGFATSIIEQITVAVNDQAGANVTSRLFSAVMHKVGVGRFKVTYTATNGQSIENLIFHITYTENAVTFVQDRSVTTLTALEDNFTAADRVTLNAIETDTQAIEADTQDIQARLPSSLNAGNMRSHVEAIDVAPAQAIRDEILDDATRFSGADIPLIKTAADDIKQGLVVRSTTAIAGSSPTAVRTNLTEANGFWDGATVVFVNAAGTVSRRVSEYVQTNGELLLDTPLPFTPAATDPIVIVSRHSEGQGGAG